jgi:hypothetical protein
LDNITTVDAKLGVKATLLNNEVHQNEKTVATVSYDELANIVSSRIEALIRQDGGTMKATSVLLTSYE